MSFGEVFEDSEVVIVNGEDGGRLDPVEEGRDVELSGDVRDPR